MLEQKLKKMMDEKLDFLPIEDVLELGMEINCRMNYTAYIEEVEDGYECDLDFMFSELEEATGIYDNDGKIIIDGYTISIKEIEEDLERIICPAPTYMDLLRMVE